MKIIISTGGTGGHIFPALVIRDEFLKENIKVLVIIGGKVKIPVKEKYINIKAKPFMGKNIFRALINMIENIQGIVQAMEILKDRSFPIIATGSYASFPILVSAFIKKIPYFLLEQNSIPGRINKIFSKKAVLTFAGFKRAMKYLKGKKIFTGNPLREFEEINKEEARKLLNIGMDERVILVLGGSQGARFLNQLTLKLSEELKDYKFILISGKDKYDELKGKIKSNIILFPFYEKMEILYSSADIAITRAGGITLYELLYFGIPSILIPFPHATDNHQLYNAVEIKKNYKFFEIIEEKDAEIKRVKESIKKLLGVEGKKIRFDSSKRIVREIKKYMEGKNAF